MATCQDASRAQGRRGKKASTTGYSAMLKKPTIRLKSKRTPRKLRVNEVAMVEYANEDVGNIVLLEHVNVQVPDQAVATMFYIMGMGFTRDPYLNIGLGNMW